MRSKQPISLWSNIATHVGITLLAVGIAFSLPQAATYILFQWWPKVQNNSQMLLYTEIAFASVLVVLLNFVKLAWHYRQRARMSTIASLVHAHEDDHWLSRWVKEDRLRGLPWKRDLTIMAVTGYGTFAAPDSALKDVLNECYELRVMLMNPYGPGAETYAAQHADPTKTLADLRREAHASIDCLRRLNASGKKVALKLYDNPPFWKLVFTGEHAWVRCVAGSRDHGKYPEYVFALQTERPTRGFFPAFYTYFLAQWNDAGHPDYALDADELVWRDADGAAAQRLAFARTSESIEAPMPRAPNTDYSNAAAR